MRAKVSAALGIVFALALLVGLAAPADAANGVITACVNNTNGQVRIVEATAICKVGETKIQWNAGSGAGAGAIMGQVSACAADMTRTLVYVEGRAFTVYTGTDGKFLIDTVPAGTYKVVIERSGQVVGQVTGVVVNLSVNSGLVNLNTLDVANTQTDPQNCGTCGNACQQGQVCTAGVCGCAPGQTSCNGACIDTNSDIDNCGACGNVCPAGQNTTAACVNGQCAAQCLPGFQLCGNACVDVTTSTQNCGGCGLVCAQGQSCVAGLCAGGGLLPNGSPSATGILCQSGFATDGFCCDQACTGTCQGCAASVTGAPNGVCAPILANIDPKNQCSATPQITCGTTGACNGAGACALWPVGTQCAGGTCTNGVQFSASTCNGAGSCVAGASQSCDPYVCGPAACKTSCAVAADCASGYACSGGQCQACIPAPEVCGDGIDNDCDGIVDDGCVCTPGQTTGCATGLPGVCAVGIRTCNATGTAFSACVGASPTTEVCNGIDDNCNGTVDEGNPGGGVQCSCPGGAIGVTACSGGGGLICVCQW